MIKILSVDFDYFVDTDFDTRIYKFPDGIDNLPPVLNKLVWDNLYEHYPELKDIKVSDAYNYFTAYLIEHVFKKGKKVLFSNSHSNIQNLFEEEEIKLVHIDHHHDYFMGKSEYDYNCGNWLRQEINLLHRIKTDNVTWIANEDSEISCMDGNVPFNMTTNLEQEVNDEVEFDVVFICLSPEWTPPHLYNYFDEWIKLHDLFKPQ